MGDDAAATRPARLFRRLAALFYDCLLVVALAFVATFAMLPLTHGEAILTSTQGAVASLYHALLVALVFGYFGRSWTRSGQTLGLRAWRMRLETELGGRVGWPRAALRFGLGAGIGLLAVIGLWYARAAGGALPRGGALLLALPAVLDALAIAVDAEGRSLLDRATRTRVVRTR